MLVAYTRLGEPNYEEIEADSGSAHKLSMQIPYSVQGLYALAARTRVSSVLTDVTRTRNLSEEAISRKK